MAGASEFQREQQILSLLASAGQVMVDELAERFEVSAVTIRKDLGALERRSLVRRIRGGAVASGRTEEGDYEMRLQHRVRAKQAIARQVAPLVENDDVIAIDSSTTCFYLASELLDRRSLVVVTNGLKIANLLMERSNATVLMPGGVLRPSAASLVGPIGNILDGLGPINKGFFGVVGLSVSHGLMEIAVEEAETKKYLAKSCTDIYGVFDSTKTHRFALHSFASLDRVRGLFTDNQVDKSCVDAWEANDVRVHITELAEERMPMNMPQTVGARKAS